MIAIMIDETTSEIDTKAMSIHVITLIMLVTELMSIPTMSV